MKKLMCVVLLLVLTVSVCSAFALTTAEKEEMYNSALTELESYLDARESNTIVLTGIRDQFVAAKYSYSQQFEYYTDVLIRVEEDDFSWKYDNELQALENDASFIRYLEEHLNDSLGSVEKLRNYAEARRAEKEGKNDDAVSKYLLCSGFFDSSERRMNIIEDSYEKNYWQGVALMEKDQLEDAYIYFIKCPGYEKSNDYAADILRELHYDPTICNGRHQYYRYVIEAGNCLNPGIAELSCTVCDKVEYETLKKDSNNHVGNMVVRNAKDATCSQNGYSGDTYCDVCKNMVSSGKEINATGKHQWKDATYDVPKTCKVCGLTSGKPLYKVKAWDNICFGNYCQNNLSVKEPIEWIVLDVNQNKNRALVISKYVLDCQNYNSTLKSVSWKTCSMNKWLNDKFLNNAFSVKERKAILTTTVSNSRGQGLFDTDGGSNTEDKVFLLSYAEIQKYFKNEDKCRCQPTAYAVKQNVYKASNGYCGWWLRSPGSAKTFALLIYSDGSCSDCNVDFPRGVRPALWIDLSSDTWKLVN